MTQTSISNTPNHSLTPKQQATLLLWQRVNTSLSAFYKLMNHFASAVVAMTKTPSDWQALGIHAKHVNRHRGASLDADQSFIAHITQQLANGDFGLLFPDNKDYPEQLKQLFDPPPLLFYRGNPARLNNAQIAMVGSRKPTVQAQKWTYDMAQYLAQVGYVITSGLAQGVDAQAHLGALSQQLPEQRGRSIGVMGTGIDVCYPKQHSALFDRIVADGGCIVTELLPGTPPNKFTFPRRNRIVAGLSLGTVVTEAALKSGSLITANLTSAQGKQVFAIPSNIDNQNAEGCHHLIREGATLIYHPDQVIEALASQVMSPIMRQSFTASAAASIDSKPLSKSPINRTTTASDNLTRPPNSDNPTHKKIATAVSIDNPYDSSVVSIPDDLQLLWIHLEPSGQDLDALVTKTKLETPVILSQLMELELLGAIQQQGGRYQRA